MRYIITFFLTACLYLAQGQIEQRVTLKSGTVTSDLITEVDSIRFSPDFLEMQVIRKDGTGKTHAIGEIQDVRFFDKAGEGCRDTTTEIVDVLNPATGKTWMDRNLGASQKATSSTDAAAYGDLYQWGRCADGHQKRNSATTSTLSSTDQPAHGMFILAPNSPYDWRSPKNDNLWQGVNGVNNPCPAGYRLPTDAEWNAERTSWSSNNAAGAFASPLKLSLAGNRSSDGGTLFLVGSYGLYWSSSVNVIYARYLSFHSGVAGSYNDDRAFGYSVRCLKD